jgi:uncharacterized protein YbcI
MSEELGMLEVPPESPDAATAPPPRRVAAHGGAPSSTLAVISRRIVSLVKEYYGKGPTHARTYHFGDVVLVLLRGGYTPVEKTLLADGYAQTVMDQRAAFQTVMQPRFKRVIEEELRREVTAFMSTTHHDPDLNAELFVLAPDARDGDSADTDGGGSGADTNDVGTSGVATDGNAGS